MQPDRRHNPRYSMERINGNKQTVLVTGASGFLGGRIVAVLSQRAEYRVLGSGRDPEKLATLRAVYDFEARPGDLGDAGFVRELLHSVDWVVHAAALSSPWGSYRAFYAANVQSTQNLLTAAQGRGRLRGFVNISTPSIYFDGRDRLDIREDDPLPKRPVNHYAATKLQAERLVQQSGLPYISLRPRAIIGPGDYTIMPRLIRAHREGRLRQIGHGRNVQDLTAVSNVVLAVEKSLTAAPEAWNEVYNITNGTPLPLWDLIRYTMDKLDMPLAGRSIPYGIAMMLANVLELAGQIRGKEPALSRYGVGTLACSCTFSIEKAQRLLGYEPQQSVWEAVDAFVEWYKTVENLQ